MWKLYNFESGTHSFMKFVDIFGICVYDVFAVFERK